MLVKDSMVRDPITVSPETSVLSARGLLVAYGVRHLPVVDRGVLVGIVSDRDVHLMNDHVGLGLEALQADLRWGRYRAIGTVMQRPVVVARPTDDLVDAARVLIHHRIGALPVVDGDRLVGILSVVDCLAALVHGDGGETGEVSLGRAGDAAGT